MRIVTWNCSRGPIAKKLAALRTLNADIAILAEAPPPADESNSVVWISSGVSSLGVQVRASAQYALDRHVPADLPNCVNPIRVTGPTSFNLLAVWTWPAPSYVKAFVNALDAYEELIKQSPTVIAGDFNGNPTHDKPRQRVKWGDAFARLNRLGLVSAYHHANEKAYGEEPNPTHHFLRKAERPFHIDFCFIPIDWAERTLKAKVESGAPWNSLSDHFPVVIDTAGV